MIREGKNHTLRMAMSTLLGLATMLQASCDSTTAGSVTNTLVSLSVTGSEIGKQGKLRIAFLSPLSEDVEVGLSSVDPSIIGVPARVSAPRGALVVEVKYDGLQLGSTGVIATFDGVSRAANPTVVDRVRLNASNNLLSAEVGATVGTSFSLNIATPEPVEITIASADPAIASVQTTITIPPFFSNQVAYVNAIGPGATTLTAQLGEDRSYASVSVVDRARLTSAAVQELSEVGGALYASVSLDAAVALPTQVSLTSSNPAVGTVPPTITVPAGASSAAVYFTALAAGESELTFTLGDTTRRVRMIVLATAGLRDVDLPSNLAVGLAARVYVYLDVTAGKPHTITLASSDPTVIAVPAQVTVPIGQSSASVSVAPLKEGAAVVTATLDGVSYQELAQVGAPGTSLQLTATSPLAVGASGYLSLSQGQSIRTVMLTSSDPTVLSVPGSATFSSSTSVPTSALKAGSSTITATVDGQSRSTVVTVVPSATITDFGPTRQVGVDDPGTEYLYVSAIPPIGTSVTFTSSDPAVLPAPAPVSFGEHSTNVAVRYQALSPGTAVLTATMGAASQAMVFYVGANTPSFAIFNNASSAGAPLQVGAVGYGYLNLSAPFASDTPIALSFTTPGIVELPLMPTSFAAGTTSLSFPIKGLAAGTTDLTFVIDGVSRSFTVTVVAEPTLLLNVPGVVTVGAAVQGSLSLSALTPAPTTVNLASTMTNLATVSTGSVSFAPGNLSSIQFGVIGVAPGATMITATLGATTVSANVTVVP